MALTYNKSRIVSQNPWVVHKSVPVWKAAYLVYRLLSWIPWKFAYKSSSGSSENMLGRLTTWQSYCQCKSFLMIVRVSKVVADHNKLLTRFFDCLAHPNLSATLPSLTYTVKLRVLTCITNLKIGLMDVIIYKMCFKLRWVSIKKIRYGKPIPM